MVGKTTPGTGKSKLETSKSDSKIPRTYRKSPSRFVDASGDAKPAPKSPSRATAANKSLTKPKSPARSKSPARTKSPSRKSPARDKSPKRSPARAKQTKSADETPTPKKTTKSSKPVSSTPASKAKSVPVPVPVLTLDSDSDSDYSPDVSEKPKARVQGRTRRATDLSSKLIEAPVLSMSRASRESREDSAMRRSTRLFNTNQERPVHLKSHYEPIVKLSEFSDEDDLVQKTSKVDSTSGRTSPSFGSICGNVIFGMLFPALMLGLNAVCTEKQCKFHVPTLAPFLKFSTYFNTIAFIASLGFLLLITLLTVLPFGGRIIRGVNGQLTYCTNGLFVTFITLILTIIAHFYNVPLVPFIRQHWMQFNVSFLVLGTLIAIMLYVKGRKVPPGQQNPEGNTTSAVINFLEGKEVNPRLFGFVDVKYVMFRVAIIAFVLLYLLFTYASLSQPSTSQATASDAQRTVKNVSIWPLSLIVSHINIQPTILTLVTIQLIYALDLLVFERTIVSSYEIQYAGTGLLKCFELLGGIFTYTLVGRYVFDNNVQLAWWKLVLSFAVFFVGYVLYRGSNLQKHTFRINPYNPKMSHYESIPTTTGRKLLVSGYWGLVRHPNYLGDILIHLSLLPYVCCAPPCVVVYATILGLVARAFTDNARCKAKYGPSWDRYCQRVKYILIPKVY